MDIDDMNQVTPKLWIGDMGDATNAPLLKANGVTAILCLEASTQFIPGFERRVVPMQDGVPEQDTLFKAAIAYGDELLDAGHTVLVHCGAGVSRSSTTLAAILVHRKLASDWDSAVEMIQKVRPFIFPNPNLVPAAKRVLELWPYDGSLGAPVAS